MAPTLSGLPPAPSLPPALVRPLTHHPSWAYTLTRVPRHDVLGSAEPERPGHVREPWLRARHRDRHPLWLHGQDRHRLGQLGCAVLGQSRLVRRLHFAKDEARHLHSDA